MSVSADDGPSPRLCHLIKWPDFDGYGFNLHAEKAKAGQYIGKVDDHSPAQLAGLKEGDRIIEVNMVNISNENHRQVVERIKSIPNETKLLVVDDNTDRWYKERKLIVKSSQANVLHYKTPVPQPQSADANTSNGISTPNDNNNEVSVENKAQPSANGFEHHVEINFKPSADDHEIVNNSVPHENGAISSGSSSPQSIPRKDAESNNSLQNNRPSSGASNANNSVPDSPTSSKSGSTSSIGVTRSLSDSGGDLNLNMSASEMRQLLAQRKKHDAKKAQIDLRQKYEIIQQM